MARLSVAMDVVRQLGFFGCGVQHVLRAEASMLARLVYDQLLCFNL